MSVTPDASALKCIHCEKAFEPSMFDMLPDPAGRVYMQCSHCSGLNRVPWLVSMSLVLVTALLTLGACAAVAILLASSLAFLAAPLLWWVAVAGCLQQYLDRSRRPFV